MNYSAKVIEDSMGAGVRLTTIEATFPRFILAEFNTHRMLSRNSASSRAIPVERRIAQVRENPFVPETFGVNRRGMQATEELDERDGSKARDVWLRARDAAVEHADALVSLGVHKQHANRVLEPFMWHTVVVTATEWANFFALRTHRAAQPEMQIVATLMRDAMEASSPRELPVGEWHLPYVGVEDRETISAWHAAVGDCSPEHLALAMSVTRCAAVSFERQRADRSIRDYASRHDELSSSGHWSPFEHQAVVGTDSKIAERMMVSAIMGRRDDAGCAVPPAFIGNFRSPWVQYRKMFDDEALFAPKETP